MPLERLTAAHRAYVQVAAVYPIPSIPIQSSYIRTPVRYISLWEHEDLRLDRESSRLPNRGGIAENPEYRAILTTTFTTTLTTTL